MGGLSTFATVTTSSRLGDGGWIMFKVETCKSIDAGRGSPLVSCCSLRQC